MAMVNMNNLLNGKDSRWLQLEVCREFQRNKCSRPDTECKFAHPPANVEVQNGRVIACYDSIKGRCNREKPPCKYFHPPQHLKDQLLINGRNHLALKNALMQQMGLTPGQPLVPGQVQAVAANPYLAGMPQVGSTYSPYFAPGPIMPTIMGPDPAGVGSPLGVVPPAAVVAAAAQQKMPRSDRLEMDMKSVGSFYYENFQAFPAGMVPYKRPAADKSGVPVYQPNAATTYQQLMQLQQPFVPVSCEYSTSTPPIPMSQQQQQQQSPATSTATSTATTTAGSSPAQVQDNVQVQTNPQEQQQQSQQQIKEDVVIPAGLLSQTIPDPAALAKEVAQQNYAKAVKLSALNQSLSLHLNPLNYTGVSLNKQALSLPPPIAAAAAANLTFPRYSQAAALPLQFATLPNPYITQQNLLNMRPAPAPANFHINPYISLRPQYAAYTPTTQLLTTAQYPVTVSAAPVAAQTNLTSASAQGNNNNNNNVVQPYKKLKTN